MNILVIESSTSSAKAMVFNSVKGPIEMETLEYPNSIGQVDEVGMQNADEIYELTAKLGKKVVKDHKIDAIVPCGTWHNILMVDKQMHPASSAYTWTYQGASKITTGLRKDKEYCNRYYQKTGCMVHGLYPYFKLLSFKEKGLLSKDYKYISQSAYNLYKLTGDFVTSRTEASGSGLLNTHTKEWDKDLLESLDISIDQLPRLVEYNEIFKLNKEGAEKLGLSKGTIVLANFPDGAMNQVAEGAINENIMTLSVGTSGALRLATKEPILPQIPSTWCYLGPNSWLSGAAVSGACNCLDWYIEKVALDKITYSDFDKIEVDIENMPIFLPFIFGERCPGWNDNWKGGFYELNPNHNIYDGYRAIQEGVLFNLYQCYELLRELNNDPTEIRLSGGITRSDVWMQMCADIFGIPLKVNNLEQASMIGGAVIGLEIVGEIESINDFSLENNKIWEPDMDRHKMYLKRYEQYLKYYQSL